MLKMWQISLKDLQYNQNRLMKEYFSIIPAHHKAFEKKIIGSKSTAGPIHSCFTNVQVDRIRKTYQHIRWIEIE